jgi:hypothetical protein
MVREVAVLVEWCTCLAAVGGCVVDAEASEKGATFRPIHSARILIKQAISL